MSEILEHVYYGNTIEQYAIALAIITGGILLIRIFKKRMLNQITKVDRKDRDKTR